jgi:hypothetical protein
MRHVISLIGLFGLFGHLGLGSLAGQQIEPALQSWEPVSSAYVQEFRADTQHTFPLPRRDYRYEGLAFGGIVFAAAGGWVGWNVAGACPTIAGGRCEPDRLGNAVAVGLVGAALGSGLGYLIGRLSSKPDPNQLPATRRGRASPDSTALIPDSTRRLVGYQHWKGAAIGAGSGALVGALLGLRARTGCSDCNMTGSDVVKASLVTAGLGGAFGFLIGLASPKYQPR